MLYQPVMENIGTGKMDRKRDHDLQEIGHADSLGAARRLFMSDWPWGLLFLGALVRLPFLGRAALWQDEIGFIRLAEPSLPIRQVFSNSWETILSIGQLPLAAAVWNVWFKIAGLFISQVTHNAFIARLPAVLLGLLGILFFNRLARRILDENTAVLCGVLFGVLFFPVYYSREAYCYALILFLAPWSFYSFRELLFGKAGALYPFFCSIAGFTALAYTHLGCVAVLGAAALVTLALWVYAFFRTNDKRLAERSFIAGVAIGLSLLSILPFVLRFIRHNKTHVSGSSYSIPIILNDAMSKMFMGERVGFAVLAWFLFASGIAWLLFSRTRSAEKRCFAGVTILSMLLLAAATNRSQYLSARYFTPVAPMIIMVIGIGLRAVSDIAARLFRGARGEALAWCACGVILAYSMIMYNFPMYSLKSKEPWDDSLVAQWLNENLTPGTPYMLFSGYRLRWVPGFYPTPGLIAVCPYVQGPGPEENRRLDEMQQKFSRRFPVSAYVGATHNPSDIPSGDWPWPRLYYRQHVELGSPMLQTLISRGIFIWEPYRRLRRNDWTIDIFYNTREDAVDLARRRGDAVYFDFSGWRCEVVDSHPQGIWAEYAWGQTETKSSVTILSLRDAAVAGRIVMNCAAAGFQGQQFRLRYVLNERSCGGGDIMANSFSDVVSDPVVLEPRSVCNLVLDAQSTGTNNPRAILVYDAAFIMTNASEDNTEQTDLRDTLP